MHSNAPIGLSLLDGAKSRGIRAGGGRLGLCAVRDLPVNGRRGSRAILAALRELEAAEFLDLPDLRSSRALALVAEPDEASLSLINDVFVGTSLPSNPEKVGLVLRLRGEIGITGELHETRFSQ